jgi:hypothetical protein
MERRRPSVAARHDPVLWGPVATLPAQDKPHGQSERSMVEPLRWLLERADERNAAADDAEIDRGYRESAQRAVQRLTATRDERLQHQRPTDGEGKVNGHRDQEQESRVSLDGQYQRTSGAGAFQYVASTGKRPRRRWDAARRCGDEAGHDGVTVVALHPTDDGGVRRVASRPTTPERRGGPTDSAARPARTSSTTYAWLVSALAAVVSASTEQSATTRWGA